MHLSVCVLEVSRMAGRLSQEPAPVISQFRASPCFGVQLRVSSTRLPVNQWPMLLRLIRWSLFLCFLILDAGRFSPEVIDSCSGCEGGNGPQIQILQP
jgi:hypothetical protein